MSETTQQRIERIAEHFFPRKHYWQKKRWCIAALTAFAEETEKEHEDQAIELIMHQTFMDSLLDDLGAPKYPDNDPTRPKYGPYGRLKAHAESIGVKASIWQPLPPAPSTARSVNDDEH